MTNSMPESHNPAATPPNTQGAGTSKNPVGTIALVTAILGFIFACIPGALIVGWVLLPIAFVLSLVSLFLAGKTKKAGIAGLIISIVGTIVGFMVFIFVAATAVDEAFSGGEVTVSTPDGKTSDKADKKGPERGTRENPLELGSSIKDDEWKVTIHSVDLNANKAISAANMFNDPPAEGNVFILVNLTAKYLGDDAEGSTPWVSVKFVTPAGNTFSSTDTFAVAPNEFDSLETLYNGASTSGNIVIEVPKADAAEGTLAVESGLLGKKVFFKVK